MLFGTKARKEVAVFMQRSECSNLHQLTTISFQIGAMGLIIERNDLLLVAIQRIKECT